MTSLIPLVAFQIVLLGLYIWYLWALSYLFPKIGLQSGHGWIPFFNEWKLFERAGMPGTFILFILIPGFGVLVVWVLRTIAMHRLNTELGFNSGYTVLGALLPPLWATMLGSALAFRVEPLASPASRQFSYNYAPSSLFNTSPTPTQQPVARPAQQPQNRRQQQPTQSPQQSAGAQPPAQPPVYEPYPGRQSVFAPPSAPASDPVPSEPEPAVSAPVAPEPEPVAPEPSPEPAPEPAADPEPVAPEPEPAPEPKPAAPEPTYGTFGAAFSADRPIADEPLVLPSGPDEPRSKFEPPRAPEPEDDEYRSIFDTDKPAPTDEEDDATVVVPRRAKAKWLLELPDGETIPLPGEEVIVGRKPGARPHAVKIPDDTRTLSKIHARLAFNEDVWYIEDLGSTNGVALIDADGTISDITPGDLVPAGEKFLLGTLEVKLRENA